MQTKRGSFIESITNIVVGCTLNGVLNWLIFPLYSWEINLRQNLEITCIYTVASLCRSYSLRRIFNRITEKGRV
jgi:hypothetical protein